MQTLSTLFSLELSNLLKPYNPVIHELFIDIHWRFEMIDIFSNPIKPITLSSVLKFWNSKSIFKPYSPCKPSFQTLDTLETYFSSLEIWNCRHLLKPYKPCKPSSLHWSFDILYLFSNLINPEDPIFVTWDWRTGLIGFEKMSRISSHQ